MESIHSKLSRVRKPRVHITYDVETEGASVKKELPFVVGVMGDFAGHNTEALKPLKDRRFVQIDRDNFDDVLRRMNPKLNFKVDNKLANDDSQFAVELEFKSMQDFEPAAIVRQVAPLDKLMATRNKLRDLMTKIDRSEELENILERVLNNNEDLQKLAQELSLEDK
ncbi:MULTISPECIES: type VI secretion system contractile sheath small subunit [Shewanella]|uniref:type VI secretion system contractile sheath small subunit n=1 Tax=Shewanella TaxID=22 RepID=UPI0001E10D02|nr:MULTISPECIES: type VI secretion system contractile sheath small subunit [Shewanella]GCF90856.1 type VI secretion protein [Shewanella sp. M-Br]AEG11318.1 type VI secretion protein, VC_A0107 family [Shewanella baltica BA175]EHQ15151.1 type VI secretion protein, VC_A0107 family [Shewanella baltica OS183]MCS6123661.1 type VI secretion system contractile sheath small subunit [Shewanella baltica]MCS6180336.1 type VI secretion system contractile sheath small subunit [Shewanella baltica]